MARSMSGNTSRSSRRTWAASSAPNCLSASGSARRGGERVGVEADRSRGHRELEAPRIVRVSVAARRPGTAAPPRAGSAAAHGRPSRRETSRALRQPSRRSRDAASGRLRALGDGRARARRARPTASSAADPCHTDAALHARCALSLTSGPRSVISQPAASGSFGTNAESFVLGSISSSKPRVSPR